MRRAAPSRPRGSAAQAGARSQSVRSPVRSMRIVEPTRSTRMLVAPFSPIVPDPDRSRARSVAVPRAASGNGRAAPSQGLLAWLVIGIGIVVCIPAARGSALLGATLPFWLVAAPLMNLAWRYRALLASRAAEIFRRSPTLRTRRQQARWLSRPLSRNALPAHAARRDRRERSGDRRSHAPKDRAQ